MGAVAAGWLPDIEGCSACGRSPSSRKWVSSRWKFSQADEEQMPSAVVRLNLYDLCGSSTARMLNQLLLPFNAGMFHCGVEVYGLEWSYGCTAQEIPEWHPVYGDTPSDSGVYKYHPRSCTDHRFCETIDLGRISKSQGLVLRHLRAMRHEWVADEYDLLEHNCCHFSVEFCRRLGVAGIPDKLLVAPKAGKACKDCLECRQDCSCRQECAQPKPPCQAQCPFAKAISPALASASAEAVAAPVAAGGPGRH